MYHITRCDSDEGDPLPDGELDGRDRVVPCDAGDLLKVFRGDDARRGIGEDGIGLPVPLEDRSLYVCCGHLISLIFVIRVAHIYQSPQVGQAGITPCPWEPIPYKRRQTTKAKTKSFPIGTYGVLTVHHQPVFELKLQDDE